jgi:predicted DNA-binding transcriptional regulator AlpA
MKNNKGVKKMEKKLLTLKELAKKLGYSMNTMYAYRNRGLIPEAQKRPLLFDYDEVIKKLNEKES